MISTEQLITSKRTSSNRTQPRRNKVPTGRNRRGPAVAPPVENGVEMGVRPLLRRWTTAGMLLVAATLAVLYISNSIAINNLMSDITSLEHERDVILGENEGHRADLLRLMSVDRIADIATTKLGMIQPGRPPQPIATTTTAVASAPRP